ncbi:MAG: hypothetical protein KF705_15010 [Phycisphaeraceae bacterium]|nr:hypothetical protein [Phycisphaeraceae bacterium]
MMTSESAARHLLHLASAGDEPVPVTHMQLQKLAYYAQGWSLALRAAPLRITHRGVAPRPGCHRPVPRVRTIPRECH